MTLYTFACGDVCDRAEALLNRRGVPYKTVNVQEQSGAEKLKKLTGELQAPVLQAGDKLMVKGFSEAQWQMLLDNAGYPKRRRHAGQRRPRHRPRPPRHPRQQLPPRRAGTRGTNRFFAAPPRGRHGSTTDTTHCSACAPWPAS